MGSETSHPKLVLRNLTKRFGKVTAVNGINLSVAEGSFVSLLGPSGCGKTTTLRLVAGLDSPSDGEIVVDGTVISDGNRSAPPEHRNMGMVFQSYAVWPHMTVFDNVAYALKLKKMPKAAIHDKVMKGLALVGMDTYADRYPTQLSGGQQQRVALARALVVEPSILLLDEPLSNLDALLRETMRFEIRQLQQQLGITAVYVTHSQEEALVVSDQIVVMQDGNILQIGTPDEIYHHPETRFVARFIGIANFLEVKKVGGDTGRLMVELPNQSRVINNVSRTRLPDRQELTLMVRPERIKISRQPFAAEQNQFECRVEMVTFTGNIVDYFVKLNKGIDLRVQSMPPIIAHQGDQAYLCFSEDDGVILQD